MKTILISYDLSKPETSEDYKKLIAKIKSFSSWAKPLESFWFIKTDETVAAVRDSLLPLIDNNDHLVVIDVTSANWGTFNITSNVTDWMKNGL